MRTSVELGSLAEIITGPFGSELHKSDYVTEGIPWIMPQNISERSLNYSNMAYINANDANRLKKYRVKTNDLVYARRGNVEKHAFITEQESGAICGTGCMIIRAENSNVVPAFLSFFLNRPESKRWITLHAVGSNMLNINTDILSSIPIKYPSTKEQNYIVCLLQKLEDKIKINKQLNDNLAAMIKAIYEYWFVQFEFPDANGKPYKSSGGKMVWNEQLKRTIPQGWAVASIINNTLCDPIKPGIKPFSEKTYLATADVIGTSIGTGTQINYETRESRANMQPEINSVWFAKMKSSIKHLFLSPSMHDFIQSSILSTGFQGLQCTERSFEYIASFIGHDYFETLKDQFAHGATQEAVNNDDLKGVKILIPDKRTLDLYHSASRQSYQLIGSALIENKHLVSLRDWLLPMLMNGQATIED